MSRGRDAFSCTGRCGGGGGRRRVSAEEVDAVDQAVPYPVGHQHPDRVGGQAVGDLVVDHPVALGEPPTISARHRPAANMGPYTARRASRPCRLLPSRLVMDTSSA